MSVPNTTLNFFSSNVKESALLSKTYKTIQSSNGSYFLLVHSGNSIIVTLCQPGADTEGAGAPQGCGRTRAEGLRPEAAEHWLLCGAAAAVSTVSSEGAPKEYFQLSRYKMILFERQPDSHKR